MNLSEMVGMFFPEEVPDRRNPEDAVYRNMCPKGMEKNLSTWESRQGDPRIQVGDHVRLCYHRKMPEHRTNSFTKEQEQVVGRIAKVVADHGHRRESRLGYIEVRHGDFIGWWRRRDVVLQTKTTCGNGWCDIDASRDVIVGKKGAHVDPVTQQEMNQNTRKLDWERSLLPTLNGLCKEALVDLCMAVTKDALKPGMTIREKRALFERTSATTLIEHMKERHFEFRNILGDVREWQDQRMQDVATGKVPLANVSNEDYDKRLMLKRLAEQEGVDLREFNQEEIAQIISEVWPSHAVKWDEKILRDWVDKHTHAQLDSLNPPMDHKTANEKVSRALGKGMAHSMMAALNDVDTIRRELDRTAKGVPAYQEGLEYQKLKQVASAAGLPTGLELEKQNAKRINKAMKAHVDGIREQLLKQIESYVAHPSMPSVGGMIGHLADKEYPLQKSSPADKVKRFNKPPMVKVPFYKISADEQVRKDVEAVKPKLAARGFPTEPLPEVNTVRRTKPNDVESTKMTDGDVRACSDRGGHWTPSERVQRHEDELRAQAALEAKKEKLERLKAEIDAIETPPPAVGTPSSLNDWLKKPIGGF